MLKQICILGLVALAGLSGATAGEAVKPAYVLEERELARRPFTQSLHGDTVLETISGIWDVDTDTLLSRGSNGGDYGDFLDFDLASRLSVFRRQETRYTSAEDAFIIEVRNPQGDILFSKRDTISHKPEAYLVSEGKYLLSRTNDADTLQLTLELHSIETGQLVWRRTPTDNPRWMLSRDGATFIELLSEDRANFHHTAALYDSLTQAELARVSIGALSIRKDSNYLARLETAAAAIGGSATLLFNETSKTLSPLPNDRVGPSPFSQSPKADAGQHHHPGEPQKRLRRFQLGRLRFENRRANRYQHRPRQPRKFVRRKARPCDFRRWPTRLSSRGRGENRGLESAYQNARPDRELQQHPL